MMKTADQIYQELIQRCKQAVKDRTRIVYDPLAGTQKIYLDDKHIGTKQVHQPRKEIK